MTIPPFPAQDLAKLVLGYLAEEELMTAYDEFLQSSPYLDVQSNEYDWLMMTSLKMILSEYRAVKIYVNTCKPIQLRKKLLQCANLAEMVKYMVNHIDMSKLHTHEANSDKFGLEKRNTILTSKLTGCEGRNSLKSDSCVTTLQTTGCQSASHGEASSLESAVEATPLEDLPGNHVATRKKHVRILDKDSIFIQSNQTSEPTSVASVKENTNSSSEQHISNSLSPIKSGDDVTSLNSTVKATDSGESQQKLQEFNDVLKSVVTINNDVIETGNAISRTISSASTFQDFASGVTGNENQNANIPDSSTSENVCTQISKEKCTINVGPKKCQLTIVGHFKGNTYKEIQSSIDIHSLNKTLFSRIKPKTDEHKIKILSDIKVDSKSNSNDNLRKKNATSTPLMQMQTIVINGTPAYRHNPLEKHHSFTKDEIMAMPTLIVVPAPGSSNQSKTTQSTISQNNNVTTDTMPTSTPRILGPLIIDVSQSPLPTNHSNTAATSLPSLDTKISTKPGLVKTVDVRNASVPKDSVVYSGETNTPQVLPPTRKSSSTPRRSSHIRVLDFTTPRRILHETINEKVTTENSEVPFEIVLSSSPNVQCPDIVQTEQVVINKSNMYVRNVEGCNMDTQSAKENDTTNNIIFAKKSNWDAELRALAIANEPLKPISKYKNSKKKKTSVKSHDNNKTGVKRPRAKKKNSPKTNNSKKRIEIDDDEPSQDIGKKVDNPVKPTINIISGPDRGATSAPEDKKEIEKQNDLCNEIETPEVDKMILQNAIGAKLNISELLETPYKQALYDIQMETPRFIGLPDEPISDIKIMNIPTPRFLTTPKHVQATPSSSSSRPTDYSSGGSYYKPDDQDYMPFPDLGCPVSSSKEDSIAHENNSKKSTRPVRQCTKNVSYYNSSGFAGKIKEADNNVDVASSCSDSISAKGSIDCKKKQDNSKLAKQQSKSETKKRSSLCRRRKSPTKEKTKSFIKIKPRRPTPTKEPSSGRFKNKEFDAIADSSPKSQRKKRTTSKERTINIAPVTSLPTKSRRKSSTPRKLHCTKTCNSESLGPNSPETITNFKTSVSRDTNLISAHDSDTEQLALRWSDDGSQDTKSKVTQINTSVNESDDISKIQEYIKTTDVSMPISQETEGTLQADLIKRGFDVETAKIIERDLLDTPPHSEPKRDLPISLEIVETKKDGSTLEKSVSLNNSVTDDLQIVQDEVEPDDEIELSVYECTEDSKNYVAFHYDDTKDLSVQPPVKLKDKFSMEVCIDDGVAIRLRATAFSVLFDQEPQDVSELNYDYKETEVAVRSISYIEKLYTPLKDPIKAQCYEIFDSTLTSLDTPLKINSPKKHVCEISDTNIVLEVEKVELKEKAETKKRKRIQSGSDESVTETKKMKPETQYMLNSASIQNIDIESVLKKLHGP